MRIHLIIVSPQMRYVAAFIILSACSACNPFYSVEQSDVERGYRWIRRGDYTQAIATFQHTISNYPNSSLAHVGLADAFAEAGRELNAVEMYTKALPLLKADGHAVPEKTTGGEQTIGARFFSYQNQGLRFPYGVEAYVHFRRGLAYEALLKKNPGRLSEYRAAANVDYTSALSLAPAWPDPKLRLECFADSQPEDCKK